MDEHVDCTHGSAAWCEVQPALLGDARFPPPSAGSLVLSRLGRTAARSTSNARVAFGVEGMAGHAMTRGIRLDVLRCPVHQGADLDSVLLGSDLAQRLARVGLGSA